MPKFWIACALSLSACAADVEPEQLDGQRVLWDCECWTSYRISSLANAAGEVVLDQDELPTGMRCAASDPVHRMAQALCVDPGSYYCDCSHCVATEVECGAN